MVLYRFEGEEFTVNWHRSRGMRPGRAAFLLVTAAVPALCAAIASADTVNVPAAKDNTLYFSTSGSLSNGAGDFFFAGRTGVNTGGAIRRGLIQFNVAAHVPAGSTITGVTVRLFMSRTTSGPQQVGLHRVSADWGEGSSNAAGNEGAGAAAANGDATWIHRFRPNLTWFAQGGDFTPIASATQSVDQIGFYTWDSSVNPQLITNVQGWLNNPATNFGWLLKGNETAGALHSAKRFDSRTNPIVANRPVLIVTYTPPAPPCSGNLPGDLDGDGMVDGDDVARFVDCVYTGSTSGGSCGCADVNQDGQVNMLDVASFVQILLNS